MFEFVIGLFAAPFIAYLLYAYGMIGKGILKDVFASHSQSLVKRILTILGAALVYFIPVLLVIPLLSHLAILAGLIVGIFFVFIFTRKRSVEQ
jgi:hypothetical protein